MAEFINTEMHLGAESQRIKADNDSDSDMDLYDDIVLPGRQLSPSSVSSLKDPSAPHTLSRRLHPDMEQREQYAAFLYQHPPAPLLWSTLHPVKKLPEYSPVSSRLTISNSDNESYTTWSRARVCESDSPPPKRLRHDEIKADLTFASTFDSEDGNDDGYSSDASDSCYVELDRPTQMQPLDPHAAASDELEGKNNTIKGLFNLELARKKFLCALMEPQHSDSVNEVNLFDNERRCFDLALAFLKETKGGDYKFVRLVTMCPLTTSKGWGTHTYFFAHLKGTNSSPELFFAEVVLAPVNSVHCCKVDPSSFSLGKAPFQFELISHCPHVKCFECVDHCNYEFESVIEVSG